MAKGLCTRLAIGNLRRGRQLYLPYCIANTVMSAVFFIVLDIIFSKSIANMSFGGTTVALMTFGAFVMTFFTIGYMFYINSFLMKRRKKELGLYGILGLEKRHVGRIIFIENAIMTGASTLFGLLCGTVFGKLIFMILLSLTDTAEGSTFDLSPAAYIITALFFGVILAMTTITNQLQIRLSSPIDLLHGEQKGEKKLRGIVPLTIVGALCIGGAYWFAYTVSESSLAVLNFWPAVVLVIIGTWALFTAGSQFVLSAIKKNKKLYYKPGNFITVSGLAHRMKQNAAGLANICILSTMVLVTVSGCSSLFFGQQSIYKAQCSDDYRMDIAYSVRAETPDFEPVVADIKKLASSDNVNVDDLYVYESSRDQVLYKDGALLFRDESGNLLSELDYTNYMMLNSYVILLDDYNSAAGTDEKLSDNEVLILYSDEIDEDSLTPFGNNGFSVKRTVTDSVFTVGKNSEQKIRIFFVTANSEARERFIKVINPTYVSGQSAEERIASFVLNFTGERADRAAFVADLEDTIYAPLRRQLDTEAYYSVTSIDVYSADGYGVYGGLLFLGILFSILFLTNTVLIIYFKQVSEGYDDRERFAILQKVGMSHDEVKSTINRQILIVFFLPLLAALLHIAAATNLMAVGLKIFNMTNFGMVIACVAVTSAVFVVLYLLVYRFTASTYYRIVKR